MNPFKTYLLSTLLLFTALASGCVSYTGPVTGKKYNHVIGDVAAVQLNRYWLECRVRDYFKAHPEVSEEVKTRITEILLFPEESTKFDVTITTKKY